MIKCKLEKNYVYRKAKNIYDCFFEDVDRGHFKAYAAESAFFLVISLVPSILFLLTLIKFTPVTQDNILDAVFEVFPADINIFVSSIVEEVYDKTISVIPITALVAVWSASRGVLSIGSGLNWIYGVEEKRGYIYTRIRATLYTLIFILAIVFSLVILVFGNALGIFIIRYIPLLSQVIQLIIKVRVIVAMGVLTGVFMVAYTFLPDAKEKRRWKRQFFGALFSTIGWLGCSLAFSVYVDVHEGFANMYGSLTTVVLIMLWLYFCMYFLLLGARLNVYIETHFYK